MVICFIAALALPLHAQAPPRAPARYSSTVRADSRSGRLIRASVVAPAAIPSRSIGPKRAAPAPPPDIARLVEEAVAAHSVDPLLIHSVIRAESNYNPLAVSPKGAEGLMQLIPATARRFGAANSFDVRENITAGVRYLKYLQDTFKDDRLALAAYNAGEGAVLRYRDIPPYRETENYVLKVGKAYGEARRAALPKPPQAPPQSQAPAQPAPEPLRALDVSTDEYGRVILRTR